MKLLNDLEMLNEYKERIATAKSVAAYQIYIDGARGIIKKLQRAAKINDANYKVIITIRDLATAKYNELMTAKEARINGVA